MCYDVGTQLEIQFKQADRKGAPIEELDYLREKIKRFRRQFGPAALEDSLYFHTSGFDHQELPVITADNEDLQFFNWGLIPFWVKTEEQAMDICNKTLNARSESMFEKPSFREAAKKRRCLVPVAGYYEHYWTDKRGTKKIPYYIQRKDRAPLYLAGLWEVWTNPETGDHYHTVALVTTQATGMLAKIHNRKPEDPRMLTILDGSSKYSWLAPIEDPSDIDFLKSLCRPIPDHYLEAYPVHTIKGALAYGNAPEATEPMEYKGLNLPFAV